MRRKAVFLDRDGVLNRSLVSDGVPLPPSSGDQVEVLPGVEQACVELKEAGFLLVVITNQPDVARGTTAEATVHQINEELSRLLPIDDIIVCFHDDGDGCECRKPADGMLRTAARRWGLDLTDCVVVGDRWRDIGAGRQAGCRTVLVDYGYAERLPDSPDHTVSSLSEAVPWILGTRAAVARVTPS